MTIRLGDTTLQGTKVLLKAPGQFGTFTALRLTNYTSEVLILNDINNTRPGQEYLFPLQQMVYQVSNVSTIATIQGISLGVFASTPAVFAEWSDDPLNDFIGTYPTAISTNPTAVVLSVSTLALTTNGVTYTVVSDVNRLACTVINTSDPSLSDGRIQWSSDDVTWTTAPYLARGEGRVINATSTIYFRGIDAGSSVEVDIESRL